MGEWNHPMCNQCWQEQVPDREPVRLVEKQAEHCCWCGQITRSGIYRRADPAEPPEHRPHTNDV